MASRVRASRSPASPFVPTPDDPLEAQRAGIRPFEDAEMALVRAVVTLAPWIGEPEEHGLRYALNLARTGALRCADGNDLDLWEFLTPLREEVRARAVPPLCRSGGVDRAAVGRLAPPLAALALEWRKKALAAFAGRLSPADLDREVCEKALVLVCGGGGGVAWSYLGAFALLEQYGLVPRLLAGTSMGAVLLLFRARHRRWRHEEMTTYLDKLTFRGLFRVLRTDSRYGLPAAMRLHLRAGIGEAFCDPGGRPLSLKDLAIPLVVAVTGVRNGALPRDPSYYEHLLDLQGRVPSPNVMKRLMSDMLTAIGELIQQRDRFARIYLGADAQTHAFDAVDAVGFSSALPGVVHYDILRDDPRMHALVQELFKRHDLFRLVDGGLVDNLPARAAWRCARSGAIRSRNAFVLGLEGFGPKLSQPIWFGLEQLAAQNVARNRPFVHHQRSFQKVLSPVVLLPSEGDLQRAVRHSKSELAPDMPFLARMCRPFPLPLPPS
ncbi:MAG TPA: patatin-like phospholipase family protein [Anaeromyxobacteraceae bacterium]|nr:patatin-like phospholipase family protein [Anaeromyxobacteraceae bacterium]